MLESSEYRIVAAALRALADKAEKEADAIEQGKPGTCGLKAVDIELMLLQSTMLNEGTINKGTVADILGKSTKSVEKYIEDGIIPHGMEEKHSHSHRWSRAMIEFIASKKAYVKRQARKYGLL